MSTPTSARKGRMPVERPDPSAHLVDAPAERRAPCALEQDAPIFEHQPAPATFSEAQWRALRAIARGDRG